MLCMLEGTAAVRGEGVRLASNFSPSAHAFFYSGFSKFGGISFCKNDEDF